MTHRVPYPIPYSNRSQRFHLTLTTSQFLLVILLLIIGLPLLFIRVKVGTFNTICAFIFVLFAGLVICEKTWHHLQDRKLRILSTFWLIKLLATLFLQNFGGWTALFENNFYIFGDGYDAYRYYYDAYDLIQNDWKPIEGTNYQGILFFYGVIFYIFGHNPIIPGFINSFITLLSSVYLVHLLYNFKAEKSNRDWKIAFIILIPEFLSWDVQTSRDSLMAFLVLIVTLSAGRLMTSQKSTRGQFNSIILIILGSLGILFVRTSIIIAIVSTIVLMALLLKKRQKMSKFYTIIIFIITIPISFLGSWANEVTGGYREQNVVELASKSLSGSIDTVGDKAVWNNASFGASLIPKNPAQAILFTPIRAGLYLAAPLPYIGFSLNGLLSSNRAEWHELLNAATSFLNIFFFPYLLAGFAFSWHRRASKATLLIPYISYFTIFASVSGGMQIIHERYRLMATLLLYSCVWIGYTSCSKHEVRFFAFVWFFSLLIFTIIFSAFKIFNL